MPEPKPAPARRQWVTQYAGAWNGYCATLENALCAAYLQCVRNHYRRASVVTRDGQRQVATLVATPMGVMVTMHGAHRLEVTGYRHLRRVA